MIDRYTDKSCNVYLLTKGSGNHQNKKKIHHSSEVRLELMADANETTEKEYSVNSVDPTQRQFKSSLKPSVITRFGIYFQNFIISQMLFS
jgi:hypothetical protein